MDNRITVITRQTIADEMQIAGIWYHGRQEEPDFLMRIFDLKKLPSRNDDRYTNAYDDIYQHVVRNNDYSDDWIYTDPRINLFHCQDEIYLKFLSTTLNPLVRKNQDEVLKLVEIYNRNLSIDGFEIAQTGEISGKPIFSGRQMLIGQSHFAAKKIAIKHFLDTAYVNSKIDIMNKAVNEDTDVAIGAAKELLETICKSILTQKKATLDTNWTLPQLLKNTNSVLDFSPKEVDDPEKAGKAIKQILGGISSIVQGVTELRNAYGTGHGKHADFKRLESKYAKLLVGVVSEMAIFYLVTNGETAELVV